MYTFALTSHDYNHNHWLILHIYLAYHLHLIGITGQAQASGLRDAGEGGEFAEEGGLAGGLPGLEGRPGLARLPQVPQQLAHLQRGFDQLRVPLKMGGWRTIFPAVSASAMNVMLCQEASDAR